MKRKFSKWLSIKVLNHLTYIPTIVRVLKNWPTFLINYLGLSNKGNIYYLRNGLKFKDNEGTLSGTIAVVFVRKHYGEIKDHSIIIDIGANLGVFAIYAANQNPNAKILCYEPAKQNYNLLCQNIALNNMQKNIYPLNYGVAAKNGIRKLSKSISPMHKMTNSISNQNSEDIYCITLDDIINDNNIKNIDLLKMNCEGAEYEIFYSLNDNMFHLIKNIRMEYHNENNENNNYISLIKFLKCKKYAINKLQKISKNDGFIWATLK